MQCLNFRGNVQTQLQRLGTRTAQATLLALADLKQLDMIEHTSSILSTGTMLRAITQVATGIPCRFSDEPVVRCPGFFDQKDTRLDAVGQRSYLTTLSGSCRSCGACLTSCNEQDPCVFGSVVASPARTRASWIMRSAPASVMRCFASEAGRIAEPKIRLVRKKRRLDEVCVENFPQYSRTMIQSWILQGKVLVDGKPAAKAGTPVSPNANIVIDAEVPKFVCRAGYKLEAAIEHFGCDIKDKVALDAGLSTGGFTDCLLQYGASYVYGVDVGYGQVAEKIRKEKRVCVMERTNLRYLAELPQMVDLVTLDLAFISILLVMPAVMAVMKPHSILITLIKPQFEARKSQVGSGGVVRDAEVHKEVVLKVVTGVEACGFKCEGWIPSPLKGAEGNIEFLACFTRLTNS